MTADSSPEAGSVPVEERVPLSVIVAYSLPMAAMSAVFMPFGIYYMRYGIEVLLVAPAAIGTIQMIARFWDAVSDPLVGYWSDRTHTRWGRRRPWLVGSAIPIGITYVMVWAPPAALEGAMVVAWLFVAYVLYETASTGFHVPYAALGLELSEGHHDRTRLFAWRTIITSVGTLAGYGVLYLLQESTDQRSTAMVYAAGAGVVLCLSVFGTAARVPERPSYRVRRGFSIRRAFGDVARNRHARIFIGVMTIEAFGMAVVPQVAIFVINDVIQDESVLYWVLIFYAAAQFGLIPLWLRLSHRFGKKRLWLFGMGASTAGFVAICFLYPGAYALIAFSITCLGVGLGIATVLGNSVAADIVDADELETGDRKEGSYTAIMNFVRKLGFALAGGVAGWGLQLADYQAGAEIQSEYTQNVILLLAGGIPAVCYGLGLLLFTRFQLDGPEHARIQAALQRKRNQRRDRTG